jgi:rod shape-determining protein MreD
MHHVIYSVLLLFVLLLQLTVVDLITLRGIQPDLVLIVLCYIALARGRRTGAVYGFGIGLIQDAVGTGVLGLSALARTLAGFFAGNFAGDSRIHQVLVPSLVVLAADLIYNAIIALVSTFTPEGLQWFQVISTALYTGFVALIFFSFLPDSARQRLYRTEPE